MSFVLGKSYCGYEFLDILKMSKIELAYRVRNTAEHRTEVLRVLPRGAQDDQEQMERFVRETKVHAQLLHPNIVTFYKAMELERQLVMTTEYVEGATLAERLQAGPMPWREAAAFMCQALSALACAHSHGVVHRDLSPENMVVTPEGVLKLTNFALAKTHNSPQLTQAGAVIGNLRYISPEQVKGSADIDARSDVYSLGVVLYETLTGKPPFSSKSHFELMLAHVNETPKPPSTLNPEVPAELEVIVMKALAKDPAARHESADAFRAALERMTAPPAVIAEQATAAKEVVETTVAAADIAEAPPAETAAPVEPVEIAAPMEPAEIRLPVEAVAAAAPVEPAAASVAVEPAETAAPVEPVEIAAPMEPAEIRLPVEAAATAAPVEPVEIAAPMEPAEIRLPVEAAAAAALVEPVEIAAPMEPAEIRLPVEAAAAAAPIEAAETAAPVEPAATAAPIEAAETPALVEPAETPAPVEPPATLPPPAMTFPTPEAIPLPPAAAPAPAALLSAPPEVPPVAPPPTVASPLQPPLQAANAEPGTAALASASTTGSDSNALLMIALSACALGFLMLVAYLLTWK